MKQRSSVDADTYTSSTIRLRRESHRMGQATRMGVLTSVLLLACYHERVDLGGPGAGGSTVLPLAGRTASQTVPALPSTPFLVTGPPPNSTMNIIEAPPRNPSLANLTTLPQPVPPISGGTLAVAADGSVAVAADPDRDLVYIVHLATDDVQTVALPQGSEPGRVVLDDHGHAHVALRNTGQLTRIALATAYIELSTPVCQHPRGLAFDAVARTMDVACADGQLVQLNADTHEVLAREQHEPDLRDVVITPSGKRTVTRFRSASLLPHAGAEVVLPDLPWPSMDVDQAGTEPAGWVSTRATFAFRSMLASDGSLWMLHERAQVEPLKDDDYRGTRSQCGPAVQPALTQLDPETGEVLSSLQLQGVSAPAIDFAISPSGTWIAVVSPSAFAAGRASVQLHKLDTLMAQARIEKQVNAEFPNSALLMCITPSFVGGKSETQAVAVAFDRNDVLYVQHRFPAYLEVTSVGPSGSAFDPAVFGGGHLLSLNDSPERDLGHEYFHAEVDNSRVSCAACHAEGLDDGHIWQSSKGARRTPSLRGGLSQTAPFAWDGEHASLDSVIQRFAGDMASSSVPPAAVNGMGRWLDKLDALVLRPSSEADTAAAASGKDLFESAELGCATCHSGPHLTNNETVDVGTGGVFQVPSLTGLALRAPYMHDGCAKDLKAFFSAPDCARTIHAKLAALSDEQAASVQAYLRSL